MVVSTFGVMFTPDQDKAAAELMRVCKAGGKIGLANWTPQGFIGQLFKTLGKHMPPPAGVKSPALWGTQARLNEMFGSAASIDAQPRMFVFRYKSPQHWLDVFRSFYGPIHKAFGAMDSQQAGCARGRPDGAGRANSIARPTAPWRCTANISKWSSRAEDHEASRKSKGPVLRPGLRIFDAVKPYAASSATSSSAASSAGFGPRRGPLASAASISLIASVSVQRCTAEISRESRSSAAS